MPIASTAGYGDMLDAAAEGGWALPAINVTSSQTLVAALEGLRRAESDGILQVTTGGAAYLAGDRPGGRTAGAAGLAAYAHEVATWFPTRIALHTDHCTPSQAEEFLGGLLSITAQRRRARLPPLFHSHMFDGSSLTHTENLERSAIWLARCAEQEVVLELESGVVGGEEDDVRETDAQRRRRYTTPADLLAVVDRLGSGERGRYLLAATFGNVHGLTAPDDVVLRPGILEEGQQALAALGKPPFQYVFHGSSGTPPEALRRTIAAGVVKVNVDTAMQFAFTAGALTHLRAHAETIDRPTGPGAKSAYDPRAWGRAAQASMAERVAAECAVLGSAGRTLAAG